MIPTAFDYRRAASIDEAIQLLKEHGSDAKLLAGGHSLLAAMKLRLSAPTTLIDITRIPGLDYIRDDGNQVAIGPTTTHAMLVESDVIASKVPLVGQAAGSIGDVQVRNMGTIGGSLAHADPAADYPACLLATEAQIVVNGPTGERMIQAADFFQGLYMTALQDDEIITEIRVPAHSANTGVAYLKFAQPASRFAVVGCAAMVTKKNGACERVRVAFTGVSHAAFRDRGVEDSLTGKTPDEATIAVAAEKAAQGRDILSDHFASEEYRRHLAGVFAKRALSEAAEKAG